MHGTIQELEKLQVRSDIPEFGPGDTVRVHVRVREGDKERVQIFEGAVIGRKGSGIHETLTVRKVSYSVGVERIFPLHSPMLKSIEVVTRGRVRRAKLTYLRDRKGKAARIAEKRFQPSAAKKNAPAEADAPVEVAPVESPETTDDQAGQPVE